MRIAIPNVVDKKGEMRVNNFLGLSDADLTEMRLMREREEHARLVYLRNKFSHLLRPRVVKANADRP